MSLQMREIVDQALTVMAKPEFGQVFIPALRQELPRYKRTEVAVAKAVVTVATTHTSMLARYKALETLSAMTEVKASLLSPKMAGAVAYLAAHDSNLISPGAQYVLNAHLRNGGRQEKLLLARAKTEVTNSSPTARNFAHKMSWGVAFFTDDKKLKRIAVNILRGGVKDHDPEVRSTAQRMLGDLSSMGLIRRPSRIARPRGYEAQR